MVTDKKRRLTTQKLKILEYLHNVKTHPNAETVYHAVKKEVPTISLGTVYRNLNNLAEQDIILKLEVNGEYRFDADTSSHQHCVCIKCGKICDMFQEDISEYALKNMKKKGFRAKSVNIIYKGLCKECSKDSVKNKL